MSDDVDRYQRLESIEVKDMTSLLLYLERELDRMGVIVNRLVEGHLNAVHVAPSRQREGDLRRADGSNWDPVSAGSGVNWYGGDRWRGLFDKKVNYGAVSNPTKDDNGSLGYSLGSLWLNNSAGSAYMLVGLASANGSANWAVLT